MKTKTLEINPEDIDLVKIKIAANTIKKGGLVAFSTETVYGLGADVFNPEAVAKIFEVKRRPLEDPLIVHIADMNDLFKLCVDVPEIAEKLLGKFWPGPLTIVVKRAKNIPDIVTAGLDTVAIRMPANQIALSLIRESRTPIAAPSANLFGRLSPVVAQDVLEDLDERIDLIIDGGKTLIGVESTVLDLTQNTPSVLRPGGVSIERLKEIIKEVAIYKQDKILSPGMYPRHYSPKARVVLVGGNGKIQVEKIKNLAYEFNLQDYSIGIMAKEENKGVYVKFFVKNIGEFLPDTRQAGVTSCGVNVKSLGPENDLTTCATNLFSVLREFDKEDVDIIIVEGVKEEGIGVAIMDRLRKAVGAT